MIHVKAGKNQGIVPTEKFLHEIERRPCLWDPKHRLYENPTARKRAFNSIAVELMPRVSSNKVDEVGTNLSKKWIAIRDHYFKTKSDPAMKEKYSSNRCLQLLAFLDPNPSASVLEQNKKNDPSSHGSSASSSQAGMTLSLPRSPSGETSSSSDEEDSSLEPSKGTATSKRKQPGQYTVVIDGVEFEQVTLDNGEVIVKLKEEVLEDCPPSKKLDARKENLSPISKKPHGNQGRQHPSPCNENQAQQHNSQVISKFLLSDHNLKSKFTNLTERYDHQPPPDGLKIVSTATLSSNTAQKTYFANDMLCVAKDQNTNVDLGSVNDMIKQVELSSGEVLQKLGEIVKPSSGSLREAITDGSIEISDDEDHTKDDSLSTQDAKGKGKSASCLDRWNAELPKTHTQVINLVGELPHKSSGCRNPLLNRSSSADSLKDTSYPGSLKRVRTNRNTVVEKTLFEKDSPLGVDKKRSPVPAKVLKTNRNTAVENNAHSNYFRSEANQKTSPNLAFTKSVGANRLDLQSNTKGNPDVDNDNNDDVFVKKTENDGDVLRKPNDDENKAFLMLLLPEMNIMSEAQISNFRMEVVRALYRCK